MALWQALANAEKNKETVTGREVAHQSGGLDACAESIWTEGLSSPLHPTAQDLESSIGTPLSVTLVAAPRDVLVGPLCSICKFSTLNAVCLAFLKGSRSCFLSLDNFCLHIAQKTGSAGCMSHSKVLAGSGPPGLTSMVAARALAAMGSSYSKEVGPCSGVALASDFLFRGCLPLEQPIDVTVSAMLSKRKSYLCSQPNIQRAGTPLGKWPCLLGAAFPELRQSSGVVACRYGGFESPEHFIACIPRLCSTPGGFPKQQQLS